MYARFRRSREEEEYRAKYGGALSHALIGAGNIGLGTAAIGGVMGAVKARDAMMVLSPKQLLRPGLTNKTIAKNMIGGSGKGFAKLGAQGALIGAATGLGLFGVNRLLYGTKEGRRAIRERDKKDKRKQKQAVKRSKAKYREKRRNRR